MLEFKFSSWLFTAIIVISFNFSSSEKVAKDVLFPRILVLEDSGTRGPSSLANILIGNDPMEIYGLRSICQMNGLCSEKIHVGTGKWLGEGMTTAVINIKGRIRVDETLLSEAINSTDLLIVEIDVSQEALDDSHLANLRTLKSFMDIWKQTVIQLKNFDQSKSNKSKDEILETYQSALKKEFDFEEKLPGVCINTEASNQVDGNAYQSFQAETSRLFQIISMMTHKESVKQLSIVQSENDVLKDENKKLKEEVIQLDSEILSLQMESKRLFQVDENTCNALDNHKNELDNHKNELDNNKNEMDNLKNELYNQNRLIQGTQVALRKENRERKAQIQEQRKNLQMMFSWSLGTNIDVDQIKRITSERPECTGYNMLTDDTRSILHGDGTSKGSRVQGSKRYCDSTDTSKYYSETLKSPGWVGPAWYRMPAGTPRIPESSPGYYHCGTWTTGWLSGVHPTTPGARSNVKYCFASSGNDCRWSTSGKVTNCGNYFVYYLENTPSCHIRYCATN